MISKKKRVYLRDTDATGVIYFTEQLRLAVEVFEDYLASCGIGVYKILDGGEVVFPIVHVEADYVKPIFVGDELEIFLSIKEIGDRSFTLGYSFYRDGGEVGRAAIVHVCMHREDKVAVPIPPGLLVELTRI